MNLKQLVFLVIVWAVLNAVVAALMAYLTNVSFEQAIIYLLAAYGIIAGIIALLIAVAIFYDFYEWLGTK